MHLSCLETLCDIEWDPREEQSAVLIHIPVALGVDPALKPDRSRIKLVLRGPKGARQPVNVTSIVRRRTLLTQTIATFTPVVEQVRIDVLTFVATFRESLTVLAQRDGARLEVLAKAKGRKRPQSLLCQIRQAKEVFHF